MHWQMQSEGESRSTFLASSLLEPLEEKLMSLFESERARCKSRRESQNSSILCVLRAIVWVCDPTSDVLIETVQAGLRLVSSFHARCILDSLNERVARTPMMAPIFLRILVAEFKASPDAANVETALSSFATCLAFGPEVRRAILQSAFDTLDGAVSLGENSCSVGAWLTGIYYFLGEYAFQLGPAFDAARMSTPCVTSIGKLRPPMLRSCVVRLAKGMLLGHWQSRRVCVDSLLKFAIVNYGGCRHAICALFDATLSSDELEELGIDDKLDSATKLLGEIKESARSVREGQSRKEDENCRLHKKVRLFISIPADFEIVGSTS